MYSKRQWKMIQDAYHLMPEKMQSVLWSRFVENQSITEISKKFRVSWSQADDLIDSAIKTLKEIYNTHERNGTYASE